MRSWRAIALAVAVTGLAFAIPAATADVRAPLYAKMKQRFTATEPGASTGWTFDGALKPTPEGEQVPPQREIRIVFHRGTRIKPATVRGCEASDEEILAQGLGACPRRSRIGSGEIGLFLGPGSTLVADVALFADGSRVLMVLTTPSGDVVRVVHLTVTRNRVTSTLPSVDLGNGYEAAIFRAKLRVPRRGSGEDALVRTPRRCPPSGRWTITYLPRYDEPHGVQRSTSSTPCS